MNRTAQDVGAEPTSEYETALRLMAVLLLIFALIRSRRLLSVSLLTKIHSSYFADAFIQRDVQSIRLSRSPWGNVGPCELVLLWTIQQ